MRKKREKTPRKTRHCRKGSFERRMADTKDRTGVAWKPYESRMEAARESHESRMKDARINNDSKK